MRTSLPTRCSQSGLHNRIPNRRWTPSLCLMYYSNLMHLYMTSTRQFTCHYQQEINQISNAKSWKGGRSNRNSYAVGASLGGSVVCKASVHNAGNLGSNPGLEDPFGRRKRNPPSTYCLKIPMRYSEWAQSMGHKSWTLNWVEIHF